MATQISQRAPVIGPVVVDFGWTVAGQQIIIGGIPQTPLNSVVTFDANDYFGIGVPKPQIPTGLTIVSYLWNFRNGQFGFGPQAGTTFTYPRAIPGYTVALQVTDSLGRTFSTAKQINLQALSSIGSGYRESSGTARS